jgi:phage gp29-like protein
MMLNPAPPFSPPPPPLAVPLQPALQTPPATPAPATRMTEPMLAPGFGPLPAAAAPGAGNPAKPPGYDPTLPFIVPQARDRWLSVLVRGYTPELVESILRGAFGGNLLYQWQLFDLMEQTWPHLQKSMNELKRAVQAMERSVVPYSDEGQKATPEAEERAALVRAAFRGMHARPDKDENAERQMRYDILDDWGKAISVQEIDYEVREVTLILPPDPLKPSPSAGAATSPAPAGEGEEPVDPSGPIAGAEPPDPDAVDPADPRPTDAPPETTQPAAPPPPKTKTVTAIMPRNTRWVHPWNYGYPAIGADLMLDTTRINSQINPVPVPYQPLAPVVAQFAPFPPNKFIIAICKQKSGHPIGAAMLRCLAQWWCYANFTTEWLVNYAQIFGQPFRWAEYDQTKPGLLPLIESMMENMGSFGWAAFPAGTKLQFLEGAKSASDNPQAYVLRFADQICDIVVLGQTLSTDVSQAGGSRALGQVHAGIRGDVLEAAGDHVAEVLTEQFARFILMLNYGNDDMLPSVLLASQGVEDSKAMADRDSVLAGLGLPMSLKYLYERHDIPPPQPGEALLKAPAKPLLPPGPGFSGSKPGGGGGGDPEAGLNPAQAKDANEQLANQVMEDLTGVEAKWLGGIKPYFVRLVVAAKSHQVTDAEFIDLLKHARAEMPDLFKRLDHKALEDHFYNSMSTALVNGVARGIMQRGGGTHGRARLRRAVTGGQA